MIKDSSKYFYVSDGQVLKSLKEFAEALPNMSDEVYYPHADRGDWSNWVTSVIKNKALAKKLSGADRAKATELLKKYARKGRTKKI
jgi:hypothetical protein